MASNPIVAEIKRQGARLPAQVRRRYVAAALETGRVESNFTNPSGGDADSAGWRQERASLYADPTNVRSSVARFFQEAAKQDRGQASYQLAADVQRPAAQYRGRYKGAQSEALSLLGPGEAPGAVPGGTTTTTTPGVDNSGQRRALVANFLAQGGVKNVNAVGALASGYQAAQDVPGTTTTTTVVPGRASPSTGASGTDVYKARADAINANHLPYQWGGGHGGKVDPKQAVPVDCSGAVSEVLGINPRVSGEFAKWGKPGAGGNVTVYANDHHVIMKIRDPKTGSWHFFGTSASNPGGGAGWIKQEDISPAYLTGFTARHQ